MPYVIASIVTAVACVGISHAFGGVHAVVPVVEHWPSAYAQAINVVEVHSDRPTTEFIHQSERTLAENRRRVQGAPSNAP